MWDDTWSVNAITRWSKIPLTCCTSITSSKRHDLGMCWIVQPKVNPSSSCSCMVWPGQQILSFVAQGYDFFYLCRLKYNVLNNVQWDNNSWEKVSIIGLLFIFYHFCFTIKETTKLVLKSFIRFYTHKYISSN